MRNDGEMRNDGANEMTVPLAVNSTALSESEVPEMTSQRRPEPNYEEPMRADAL